MRADGQRVTAARYVAHPSDVLNNAHAATVPNIDPKGKVRLGFHGQVRLELTLARRLSIVHVVAFCLLIE